ncbi:MAG: hypothetical protein A3J83_01045 [Elusimicrobia bacterium RIFOXYA2_FULL_40_6]|nr:MAG: hypothetical protein A3J83_01045 [Elusimicrobia bacterium RIFOXYA2_FULL_40_6]
MYLSKNDIFNEYLFLFLLLIQLLALFMTFSTTAWAGSAVAAVFVLAVSFRSIYIDRVLKLLIPLALAGFLLFIFGIKYYPKIGSLKASVMEKYSNTVKKSTYKIGEEFYRADFVKYEKITHIRPGMYRTLKLSVKNTGTRVWKSGSSNPIQLTYMWENPRKYTEKNVLRIRTRLPGDVKPGETVALDAFVRAPLIAGPYRLKWDMVEEFVADFQDQGRSVPLVMDVDVSGPVQSYKMDIVSVNEQKIEIKNTGTLAWNHNGSNPVRLSYRWMNSKGIPFPGFEPRISLLEDIKPGRSVTLSVKISKPERAEKEGFNTLKFDMVKEFVIWFDEQNSIPPNYIKNTGPAEIKEYTPNLYTIIERWWLWRAGLNMFKDHPAFGVGLANYTFLYNRYKPADAMYKSIMPVVNNQYIEVLVETGIVGAMAFLFFMFTILKNFRDNFGKIADLTGRIIFAGLLGCLLALAFQLNFFCGKVLHYLWITLGLAFAAIYIYSDREKPEE